VIIGKLSPQVSGWSEAGIDTASSTILSPSCTGLQRFATSDPGFLGLSKGQQGNVFLGEDRRPSKKLT
jgi:hypothetical protein